MPPCDAHPSGPSGSTDLVTVAGRHVEAPSLETIRSELYRLTRSPCGSSVTLVAGRRSLRVKFRPDAGFDVLTYRHDHAVDDMYTMPARVVLRGETPPGREEVECQVLLGCIASFLSHAAA